MWFAENLTEYMSQEENKIKKGKSEPGCLGNW